MHLNIISNAIATTHIYIQVYIIQNKRPMGHIAHLIDSSQVNFQIFLKIKVYV